jgi:hypothetical protein
MAFRGFRVRVNIVIGTSMAIESTTYPETVSVARSIGAASSRGSAQVAPCDVGCGDDRRGGRHHGARQEITCRDGLRHP